MWYPRTAELKLNFSMFECPGPIPDSPHLKLDYYVSIHFVSMVNFMVCFEVIILNKLDQKSILSWRCHKFKWKRRYNKWNFAFFRLDKMWKMATTSALVFQNLDCLSLFVYINATAAGTSNFLFFFQHLHFQIGGAAHLRMRVIHGCLR